MTTIIPKFDKAFDRQELLHRCLGIDSFANRLLAALARRLPLERSQLRTAVEQGDYTTVTQGTNRLKETASNLCAPLLLKAATALGEATKQGWAADVNDRWNEMEIAIDEVLCALEEEGIV